MNPTIIKSVEQIHKGQVIGLSFTNNFRQYKIVGRVENINGNTIKIMNLMYVGGYEPKHIFTYSFKKSTKSNHVFSIPLATNEAYELTKEIIKFNEIEERDIKLVTDAANKYWDNRIKKAEQEHKDKGVYKESTVYEIDFGKGELVPKYNKYGVSV